MQKLRHIKIGYFKSNLIFAQKISHIVDGQFKSYLTNWDKEGYKICKWNNLNEYWWIDLYIIIIYWNINKKLVKLLELALMN